MRVEGLRVLCAGQTQKKKVSTSVGRRAIRRDKIKQRVYLNIALDSRNMAACREGASEKIFSFFRSCNEIN